MQSVLSLHSNHGLPLCLAGITHTLTLYKEMEDHDQRRVAMKKHNAYHEMRILRNHDRVLGEVGDSAADQDLAGIIYDLSCIMSQNCTAKAA